MLKLIAVSTDLENDACDEPQEKPRDQMNWS